MTGRLGVCPNAQPVATRVPSFGGELGLGPGGPWGPNLGVVGAASSPHFLVVGLRKSGLMAWRAMPLVPPSRRVSHELWRLWAVGRGMKLFFGDSQAKSSWEPKEEA